MKVRVRVAARRNITVVTYLTAQFSASVAMWPMLGEDVLGRIAEAVKAEVAAMLQRFSNDERIKKTSPKEEECDKM